MATWHQDQAMKRVKPDLRHATEYTVVINPLNVPMSCMRFRLKRDANVYRRNVLKNNPTYRDHEVTILAPTGKRRV